MNFSQTKSQKWLRTIQLTFLFPLWHLINGTVSLSLINFWNSFFFKLQAIFAKTFLKREWQLQNLSRDARKNLRKKLLMYCLSNSGEVHYSASVLSWKMLQKSFRFQFSSFLGQFSVQFSVQFQFRSVSIQFQFSSSSDSVSVQF